MAEVSKLRATRQVTDALRTRNGPITPNIPLGSSILVWRSHEKNWTGPYTLIAINGETATVQMPHGPSNFRTTCIKHYNDQNTQQNEIPNQNLEPQTENTAIRRQPARNAGLPARYRDNIFMNNDVRPNFVDSRRKELDGLLNRGVFAFINVNEIPPKARIFNSRFVDRVKNEGTANAMEKSRL
ncbi:hypothetical protein K3495_g17170, partial [Podosphaera aphanis]